MISLRSSIRALEQFDLLRHSDMALKNVLLNVHGVPISLEIGTSWRLYTSAGNIKDNIVGLLSEAAILTRIVASYFCGSPICSASLREYGLSYIVEELLKSRRGGDLSMFTTRSEIWIPETSVDASSVCTKGGHILVSDVWWMTTYICTKQCRVETSVRCLWSLWSIWL